MAFVFLVVWISVIGIWCFWCEEIWNMGDLEGGYLVYAHKLFDVCLENLRLILKRCFLSFFEFLEWGLDFCCYHMLFVWRDMKDGVFYLDGIFGFCSQSVWWKVSKTNSWVAFVLIVIKNSRNHSHPITLQQPYPYPCMNSH